MKLSYLITLFALNVAFAGASHALVVYGDDNNFARISFGEQDPTAGLLVKNAGASSSTRAAFIKFDLAGLNPDGTAGATFTISFQSSTDPAAITYEAYALDSGYVSPGGGVLGTDWTTGDLDYSSAPGRMDSNSGGLFISTADYTSIGTETITPNDTVAGTALSFSIGQLSDYLQSDNTVTIAFFGNTNTSPITVFSSITSGTTTGVAGTAPRLDFAQIPEPTTYALLLGIGVLGILFLRRR